MPRRVKTNTSPRPGFRLRQLQLMRPRTEDELHRFVSVALGLSVPRVSVSGMGSPFDYLRDAYCGPTSGSGDCVVWANRGGGKTMLGAAATLLNLLFLPGVQVRVLGGSLSQSEKMYEHLRALLDRPVFRGGGGVLAGEPTSRRVVLANGSRAELLAGSQRSVRGTRVHILRCDEVEEMDPEVWEAAQLVTRSGMCGGELVRGRVEALSTMHRPGGLMAGLTPPEGGKVCTGGDRDDGVATSSSCVVVRGSDESPLPPPLSHARRLFKWNALDVAARCPEALPCDGCVLWDDCGGRAKRAAGFVPVEDLMRARGRVSDGAWSAEMMCRRPATRDSVYPMFVPERHVLGEDDPRLRCAPPRLGGDRAGDTKPVVWVGGMDFGLRGQTTLLWATADGVGPDAVLVVHAAYAASGRVVAANLEAAEGLASVHGLPGPAGLSWLAADPAGEQRNGQTGQTNVAVLRSAGCRVLTPRSRLAVGIEHVRRRLDRGLLWLHPRCVELASAMSAYHFDPRRPHREEPVKDGPDHLCDALRYLVVAQDTGGRGVTVRRY